MCVNAGDDPLIRQQQSTAPEVVQGLFVFVFWQHIPSSQTN